MEGWGNGGRRQTAVRVSAHPHAWAALAFAALVFAYLWPALIGEKVFSANAVLYGYPPWMNRVPSDIGRFYNWNLSDLPLANYPWRFLVRALIREGTFPAWNPFEFVGIPLYPNVQTGLFSLFDLPLWTLPLSYGLGVSAALKLFVGALGTYALVRQLQLAFLPGVLAGVAFSFCAVNVVWLPHETLPAVLVMLPWALWLVERIFERSRLGSAIALSVVIGIALGGGHPGMQVHILVFLVAYVALRAACARKGEGASRLRALALIGGGIVGGVLLMAVMLIPEEHLSRETVGLLARRRGELPGQRLPFAAVETVLFPDRWGRPSAIELMPFGLSSQFIERTFYPGAVALLLACVAVFRRQAWRRMAPFALLGVVGLAVALRAPGLFWLVTHLPLLGQLEAQRLHFAFEFGVAVLAAFGLQEILDAPGGRRRRLVVPLVAVVVAATAMATAGARSGDATRTLRHFLVGTDFARPGVLALTSNVWFLLFALGVGAALLVLRAWPRWRVPVAVGLVALATADGYHFANGWAPMGPPNEVFPPKVPAVAYLQQHRDDGRIVGVNSSLPNDWNIVYGLEDVRGYDPPQPTRRMFDLWRVVNPEQTTWYTFSVPTLTVQGLRVLSVLGARYVVTQPDVTLGVPRLRRVYVDADAQILENPDASPRAFVARKVFVAADERRSRARITDAGFDPRTDAVVERGELRTGARPPQAGPVHGSVAVTRRANARVTLDARLDRRGLVVLDEAIADGWTVRVDGRPAPALHADDVMRGVIVPAGRHEIVWSYAVPGLRLGTIISVATLAALVSCALALAIRARREPARR